MNLLKTEADAADYAANAADAAAYLDAANAADAAVYLDAIKARRLLRRARWMGYTAGQDLDQPSSVARRLLRRAR